MANDNPKLRKNGGNGTFFGNLLRGALSLGKVISPGVIGTIANATGLGDVPKIVAALKGEKLPEQTMEFLMAELEADKTEMEEVTKRWEADAKSDDWLPRNVRPMTLVYLLFIMTILIILDSALKSFKVEVHWVALVKQLLLIVFGGYFGARSVEKVMKIYKGN
jgi:hypothetical protein